MSLADLKDAVLGVEATSYLQHMLDDTPTNEPLLAALGGDPIALKAHIENDLNRWKENKMRPLFVFDGQSVVGKDEMALRQARAALTKTQKAWDMYSKNQPEEAVRAFGASGKLKILRPRCHTDGTQALFVHKIYIDSYRRSWMTESWNTSSHPSAPVLNLRI